MSAPECTCLIVFADWQASIDYCPLHAAAAQMYEALDKLFMNRNTIEVLGEWSAMDSNHNSEKRERAKMEAIYDECRAAIAAARGETERGR